MKKHFKRWGVLLVALLFLAACAQDQAIQTAEPAPSVNAKVSADSQSESSPVASGIAPSSARLGTQWGEGMTSRVTSVRLNRLSESPLDVTQISYTAAGRNGRSINEAMIANGRIGLAVLNDRDATWPLTQSGSQLYLQGKKGERYQLFYRNYSETSTYEIVATVDGLDVVNGSAGSFSNRGYVLKPNSTLTIEGFRKSDNEVAAFRFSEASSAYAANTPAGSIRNTGVIGTAVFELDAPRPTAPRGDQPQAFPGDSGYAPAPRYGK